MVVNTVLGLKIFAEIFGHKNNGTWGYYRKLKSAKKGA